MTEYPEEKECCVSDWKVRDWSEGDFMAFMSGNVEYLRVEAGGSVRLGPGLTTTDEASLRFWDAVLASFPGIIAAAEKRGRVAGLREAAAICKSDATEGDTDFVAFTLDRMADKLEAETP